jgi:hypothetical protein
MVRIPFILAVMAAMGVPDVGAHAQKARDACSLLTAAEIQTLAGGATAGTGTAGPDDALGSRTCQYRWGTGNNVQSGRSYLNVSSTEISKAFPGTKPSIVAQGLLARGQAGKPDTAVIPGIGDAALYESNDPIRVVTTTLAKGYMLIVSLESKDARAQKDQIIGLLKAAAGRLGP